MSDAEANTYTAPDCDRCGTRMYESSRVMRTHDIIQGKAVDGQRIVGDLVDGKFVLTAHEKVEA